MPGDAQIVGRREEIASITAFLASSERALVLEGEAGIGKSILWLAGLALAEQSGLRVVSTRATAVEAALPLIGLRDLVGGIAPSVRLGLPLIQQRAVAVLLAEQEPEEHGLDAGLLEVAMSGLFGLAAEEQRLLLAVDDLQWLDPASGALLVATMRRASGRIQLLATSRVSPDSTLPFSLDHALDPSALVRRHVGPLSEGAIRRLIRLRLGLDITRHQLHALYAASQGNPLFALELARGGVETDAGGEIQLPPDLQELVRRRLSGLPKTTRDALLVVAMLADPGRSVLERAGAWEALAPAIGADVLEVDRRHVRFAHPLIGASVVGEADDERRRSVHRLLADIVDDEEERTLHLAATVEAPDAGIASRLAAAATAAFRRGAASAAADLLDRALHFTPAADVESWAALAADAARAHARAGQWDSVMGLVAECQKRMSAGPARAAVLLEAVEMQPGLTALLDQAVAEAGTSALGVRARIGLTEQAALAGRWDESVRQALAAADMARTLGDERLLGLALAFAGGMKLLDAQADWEDHIDEALAIERRLGEAPPSVFQSPRAWSALGTLWRGAPDDARDALHLLARAAEERGDVVSRFQLAQLLVVLEIHAGRWPVARALSEEAREEVEALGYAYGRSVLDSVVALLEALEGNVEAARATGDAALAILEPIGDRLWSAHAHAALLLAELSCGRDREAMVHADAISALFDSGRECIWSFHQGDELEALTLAGRWEEAADRAASLKVAGELLHVPRFLAWADRGDALLAEARGDLPAAAEALEAALAAHATFTGPFERARTELALGRVLRRQSRRRAARASLERALSEFERLGASVFADRARNELRRIGGRTPTGSELTPAEQRIADLVAAGLSNKDVAARLVLAVSTVESTLTGIYRKLGVRSRSQLARRVSDGANDL